MIWQLEQQQRLLELQQQLVLLQELVHQLELGQQHRRQQLQLVQRRQQRLQQLVVQQQLELQPQLEPKQGQLDQCQLGQQLQLLRSKLAQHLHPLNWHHSFGDFRFQEPTTIAIEVLRCHLIGLNSKHSFVFFSLIFIPKVLRVTSQIPITFFIIASNQFLRMI